jgi:hypothetical protein
MGASGHFSRINSDRHVKCDRKKSWSLTQAVASGKKFEFSFYIRKYRPLLECAIAAKVMDQVMLWCMTSGCGKFVTF